MLTFLGLSLLDFVDLRVQFTCEIRQSVSPKPQRLMYLGYHNGDYTTLIFYNSTIQKVVLAVSQMTSVYQNAYYSLIHYQFYSRNIYAGSCTDDATHNWIKKCVYASLYVNKWMDTLLC